MTISGAPDISYSLDGAPFTPGTSLVVNGTGVHSLDFQGSDGSHGSLAIPIDVSNPSVSVNGTYGFGSIAHALCADSGSGIATCTVLDPLDTSSAGTKTIHADALDRAGHEFHGDLTYTVTAYSFTGFFPPISNLPTLNVANAQQHPHQVQPLRFPRFQPVCPGISGLAGDDLRWRPYGPGPTGRRTDSPTKRCWISTSTSGGRIAGGWARAAS